MKELKDKLFALCIFRDLLEDEVLDALFSHIKHPSVASYAEFVSLLYEANGGDLGEYVKELCLNSENVYVKTVGARKSAPSYMRDAVEAELDVLQEVSALNKETLCAPLKYNGFLPDFTTTKLRLKDIYLHRAENIEKYGYGIYAKHKMFYADENGCIVPVLHPDKTELCDLVDYERERQIVIDNTEALLAGKPAANILLTGDAGTGKSSTVKAVANYFFEKGIRLVEIRKNQLLLIPKVMGEISKNPLKFIIFIDDLSFNQNDDNFSMLKATLEGSASAKAKNAVIYATSNRRHIVKETFGERAGDDIHRNDTVQETLSLSERFGLTILFAKPEKKLYLEIVHELAERYGIAMDARELETKAEAFALNRGYRSARCAEQFIDSLL